MKSLNKIIEAVELNELLNNNSKLCLFRENYKKSNNKVLPLYTLYSRVYNDLEYKEKYKIDYLYIGINEYGHHKFLVINKQLLTVKRNKNFDSYFIDETVSEIKVINKKEFNFVLMSDVEYLHRRINKTKRNLIYMKEALTRFTNTQCNTEFI